MKAENKAQTAMARNIKHVYVYDSIMQKKPTLKMTKKTEIFLLL